MSAARVCVTARAAARCEHVFADHQVAETARWAARIDAEFPAAVGWDASTLVLVLPPEHPLLGRSVCRAAGCATTAATRERICFSCCRRLADGRLDIADVDQLPALVRASAEPVDEDEACLVAACGRARRHADGTYCDVHERAYSHANHRAPVVNVGALGHGRCPRASTRRHVSQADSRVATRTPTPNAPRGHGYCGATPPAAGDLEVRGDAVDRAGAARQAGAGRVPRSGRPAGSQPGRVWRARIRPTGYGPPPRPACASSRDPTAGTLWTKTLVCGQRKWSPTSVE